MRTETRQTIHDGDEFTHKGYTFKLTIDRDDYMGEPWKESDGHGTVSDWRRDVDSMPSKAPGERVLVRDRSSARYYDFAAAVKTARKDGWGCKHSYTYNVGRYVFVSGHATAGELAQCAAECDYDRMRRWCTDDWWWVTARVDLMDVEESVRTLTSPSGEYDTLSGIESDAGAYFDDVARELADQIVARIEVDTPDVQLSEN